MHGESMIPDQKAKAAVTWVVGEKVKRGSTDNETCG